MHGGAALFTSLGFAGLYLVLGLLFVALVLREVAHGAPALQVPASAIERPRALPKAMEA